MYEVGHGFTGSREGEIQSAAVGGEDGEAGRGIRAVAGTAAVSWGRGGRWCGRSRFSGIGLGDGGAAAIGGTTGCG